MTPKPIPRPTDTELEILNVLWLNGASTVKQVHEALSGGSQRGYTTVLKLMQIMSEKGLLERDERTRAHIYSAHCDEEHTQRQLMGDLLDRAFSGSASKLVMQALASREASDEELAEIRQLLNELEGESQ
ncbi:MAG: BlaI/MecI/CopY family transcriptional regulator [bacterium]|nr:BlaI/MecI/CopY family transcriptional regulator [bacterium]